MSVSYKCPNCANSNPDQQVYSAKGTKVICLKCFMSWPIGYAKKTYHKAAYRAPKTGAPTYVQLYRENQALKKRIETLLTKGKRV